MLAVDMDEKTSHIRGTGERIAAGALVAVAGLLLYTVGVVVYRLWFHPLSKFPGPFINRVSGVSTNKSYAVQNLDNAKMCIASRCCMDSAGTFTIRNQETS